MIATPEEYKRRGIQGGKTLRHERRAAIQVAKEIASPGMTFKQAEKLFEQFRNEAWSLGEYTSGCAMKVGV